LEQTSTTSSPRVDRVVKVLPHEVQRTLASRSSGWIVFRKIASLSGRACLARRHEIERRRESDYS